MREQPGLQRPWGEQASYGNAMKGITRKTDPIRFGKRRRMTFPKSVQTFTFSRVGRTFAALGGNNAKLPFVMVGRHATTGLHPLRQSSLIAIFDSGWV